MRIPRPGRTVAAVAAITALGAALRFATLAHQSLWLDELYTRWLVTLPREWMLEEIPRTERTPYLYYLVQHEWVRVFGASEAGLRSLSALAGTATIPFAYLAGAALVTRRAGLIAALLVAVNPFLVWYSQEARAYALATLFVAAGLAFAAQAHRGSTLAVFGWGIASALAIATHYFAVFVVAAEVVWLLAAGRPARRLTALSCVLPFAVGLLHLRLVRGQSGGGVDLGTEPLVRRLVGTGKDFVVGFSFPLETAGSLLGFALVAAGIALAFRLSVSERRGVATAAAIGATAIALPVLLAIVGTDYIVPRNLIVALVPLLVALGGAFAGSRLGLGAATALSLLSVAIVVAVTTDLRYGRTDWRSVGQASAAAELPRALIVTPAVRTDLIQPYLPGAEAIEGPVAVHSIAVVALATQGGLSTGAVVPPAPAPETIPEGFVMVSSDQTPTYSVALFTTEGTRVVTPAELNRLRFTPEPGRLFLQTG